jgi:hypothetical protein
MLRITQQKKLWSEKDLYEGRSSTVYYYGDLLGSSSLTLNWTTSDPDVSGSTTMYKNKGLWSGSFTVPQDITAMSFSVEDNEGTVDDNDGEYWTLDVLPTYNVEFTCVSSVTSSPISGVSFYLSNNSGEYYSAYSNNEGIAKASGVGSGTFNVNAYSSNWLFENGTSNDTFTIDVEDADYTQEVVLTFTRGSMSLSFTGVNADGYNHPLSGMPLDLYLEGEYQKSVNIYASYYSSASAYDSDMAPGNWTAVLDGFKSGKSYKAEVEFEISETTPQFSDSVEVTVEDDPDRKMVFYYNSTFENANIHYLKDDGSWTEVPGLEMRSNYDNWYSIVIDDADEAVFCFNNGEGQWDSQNGANYTTSLQEVYVRNGKIYTSKVIDNQLALRVPSANVPEGYNLQVRVNQEIYGNEPWSYGYSMYKPSNSDMYSGSLYFENGTALEYKYVLVDQTGFIYWETLEGNRSALTPDFKEDSPVFEVDNKLVTFTATGLTLENGYTLELRGSFSEVPWSPITMFRNGYTSYTKTIRIEDDSFEYKYTILDPNGHVIWENFDGNRLGSSPGSYNDSPSFSINETDVVFTATASNMPADSVLEVRGSFSNWSPVILDFSGNDTWTKTVSITTPSFEYKYTCMKADGTVLWEAIDGNRDGSSPGSFTDKITF